MSQSGKRKPVVAHVKTTYLNPTETFIYERIRHVRRYEGYVLADKVKNRDRFPYPRIYVRNRVGNAAKFLKRRRTALIHAYFGTTAVRILPMLKKTDLPLVVSLHGKDVSVKLRDRAYRKKLRAVFRRSAAVLVVSGRMKRRVLRFRCPPGKIHVVKTGVDLAKFPFRPRTPPRRGGKIRLLSVGRLVPKKGMDVLVKAFAKVRKKYRGARLAIVGDGPERKRLKRLARKYGVRRRIRWKGELSPRGVRKQLRKAHIFVLASRTARDGDMEGLPNSIVEAMAAGVPVVSTNHAGIPEVLRHGRTGLMARENSAKDLARQVVKMIKRQKRWSAWTRAARTLVEREHDIRRQARKTERIYAKVIGARRRPEAP